MSLARLNELGELKMQKSNLLFALSVCVASIFGLTGKADTSVIVNPEFDVSPMPVSQMYLISLPSVSAPKAQANLPVQGAINWALPKKSESLPVLGELPPIFKPQKKQAPTSNSPSIFQLHHLLTPLAPTSAARNPS